MRSESLKKTMEAISWNTRMMDSGPSKSRSMVVGMLF